MLPLVQELRRYQNGVRQKLRQLQRSVGQRHQRLAKQAQGHQGR